MSKKIIENIYPLSPMQSGLLFQALYATGSDTYFIQNIFELEGEIDSAALKKAWQKVSDFHPVLRTGFVWEDGEEPGQYVLESTEVHFVVEDWKSLAKIEEAQKLEAWIKADRQKGVNLTKAPLFRLTLVQCSHKKYYLIWSYHHILTDGWCLSVIFGDVFKAYEAFKQGSLVQLNSRRPYQDYIAWLQKQELSKAESFWKDYLASVEEPTHLSFNNIIEENQEKDYDTYSIALSVEETDRIKAFAAQNGLTLNTVIQGAVGLVLKAYTQQPEVVLGVTVSGRGIDLPGVEEMVGLFINTLPLKITPQPTEDTLTFLKNLQDQTQKLNDYAYTPLAQIQAWSGINQSLFDVIFVFENYPPDEEIHNITSDFTIRSVKSIEKTEYPLTILVGPGKQIHLELSYQTKHFNEVILKRFLDHIRVVLQGFLYNSKENPLKISLLTEEEKHQLLIEWNDTKVDYPKDKTIHQLFEEQVKRTPHNTAVVYEDQELTYQQLNERANQLAHHLRKLGVGPDTLVAIAVERSLEMIIGILGVLKAGGAYVPLDPSYPVEHLQFILEDTNAPVLLTQVHLLQQLPPTILDVILLDKDQCKFKKYPTTNPISTTQSHHLAYIIYTSGSTGKSKGVMVEHQNVHRLFTATQHWFDFNSQDVWTLFHSYAFDFSVWEIWGALLYGGKLCVVSYEVSRDPSLFHQVLIAEGVTVLNQTPSAFQQLANYDQSLSYKTFNHLRYIIFGGEALNPPILKPWFEQHGDKYPQLINMYGITETTVHVTYLALQQNIANQANSLIGRPIPDIQCYILDSGLNLLPPDVIGEIYIGGGGVARGYLNRPNLTKEKFIANPFASEKDRAQGRNTRLYKTGDLARYLSDGNIEYIGRSDDQVKIRGFRIELGEIEAALLQHDAVREAIVIAREDIPGSKKLVAYLVFKDNHVETGELRRQLKGSLPEYMIPSAFVTLEKIPLTSNGKVDRKSFPAPEYQGDEQTYVAPRTETEKALCKVWEEVLCLSDNKMSIYDNFFELGGDSILAIRLVSKINKELNSQVKVRDIFELNCVSELGKFISNGFNYPEIDEIYIPFSLVDKEYYKNIIPENNLIEDIYPASYLQMGMLLEPNLENNSTYHDVFSYFIKEKYDPHRALFVWKKLVKKHELLRASFILSDDHGFDVLIHKKIEIDYYYFNTHDTKELIDKERLNNFRYEKPGLFRVIVNDLESSFDLIFSFHHAIADGWSMASLINEFVQAYINNEKINLNVNLRYGEFVKNEISAISNQNTIKFWMGYLNDINITEANWKFSNERSQSSLYISSFNLDAEQVKLAHNLSKSLKISVDTIFLLSYLKTLSFFTNNSDVTIGLVVNNRLEKEGGDRLFGLFLNTIPFRFDLNYYNYDISQLSEVFNRKLKLKRYQDLPYGCIKSLLRKDLYKFSFNFVHFHILNDSINTLASSSGYERTSIPFSLNISQNGDVGLSVHVSVHDDYMDKGFLDYFMSYYKECLSSLLKGTNSSLNLTKNDQKRILKLWNNTKADYPEDKTIHQLFEEQVENTPNNIAVVYEDQELSYQQLNERANQLAHHLRTLGVGPDTLVAIAVERSLEMIIGLLGILKAGGAYVPLDPTYPQERLQFMLEDTNAPIIITDLNTIDKIPSTFAQLICLNDDWNYIRTLPSANLESLTTPHNLAYVIYTSGSTGKPKGVMIGHRNFIHYVNHAQKSYPITNGSALFHSSPAFDMSITSLFLPLVTGNSINILPEDPHGNALADILKTQNSFSFIKLTPTHLKTLKSQLSQESIHEQRTTLVVGGENLLKKDIEFWLEETPNTPLFNEYGPTETTVGCCVFELKDYHALSSESVPIGSPISNTQIYILDTQLNPVPVGVSGEIYIGGVGLARGYLNRLDLTADRFIPNPFVNDVNTREELHHTDSSPSAPQNLRLYRTGDLARYLPDGNIEFLGRIDEQVKIRGFRIELGEIESTLQSHGDVTQAVLIAREEESDNPDNSSNKKLVAYIVLPEERISSLTVESALTSSAGEPFSVLNGESLPALTEDLRNHLARSLPDYMIPSFFVYIDKLPLTSNGKIDRKALPAPNLSSRLVGDEYVAPQTPLEQELANIWSEVLKIKKIGTHDNFFTLGGHSLLATQVISRIRQTYNIDVPFRSIFDHSTIASLGTIIESLIREKALTLIPPLLPMERKGPVPLSFAQSRLWFLDQLLPEMALYNIPIALRLKGSLDALALEKALNTLIDRHESLRTIFPSTKGEAHQVILPSLRIKLVEYSENLTHLSQKERIALIEKIIYEEAHTPFHLSTGPLIRAKIVILSKKEHILLITQHHIISDGWSTEIFFTELSTLYTAYIEGRESSLLPLVLQYADFALWQRDWLQGKVLEQQLSYWKQQLAGIPDLMDFPTDKPRPKELTYQGASYHTTFSPEIKDPLNQLAQDHQVSLFMTLLCAFQILLYRYTGQQDIIVGSPIANRHYKETEDLIGFFVNTLALRTTFEGNETFIEILLKVKETTLQAYQHQDVPFEQLVDHLNITRELNRNPVFQTIFTFQNNTREGEEFTLKGLSITSVSSSYPVAKFDLSFSVYENKKEMGINIDYATDLFDRETIERVAHHFKELLHYLVKNPYQLLHTYPLLSPPEQHQLLIEWNDTKAAYPEDKTIHQLFEKQVERTPNNVAVVFENQELTYQQLNEKSNQLAYHLRRLGIKPDTLVAIAVERSLEMIIGLLAILKAGGAYVPLDPSYPEERLQFMLQDTKAPILLTQSSLKDMFKNYSGAMFTLDGNDKILEQPKTNLISITTPSHLAYVIYTSGSTGKPKGVMVRHQSVINCVYAIKRLIQTTSSESFLALTSLSFDVAALDYYLPFLTGSKVILASQIEQKDGFKLVSLFNKHLISSVQGTPSLFRMITETGDSLNHKIKILLAGEVLPKELSEQLLQTHEVFNIYGPTEGTIYSTLFRMKRASRVSIGHPLPNIQTYILDVCLNPVPLGVVGEIYIGGAGLTRGYLNQPDLTADKFIPNAFVHQSNEMNTQNLRLYRTGDLARYLPNGNIEFLGRIDDQVKIRGFRIECKEVEAILNTHESLSSALVLARDGSNAHKTLIAYIVLKENEELSRDITYTSFPGEQFSTLKGEALPSIVESLRSHLLKSLPDYMIPSFFIVIDRFPMMPNGKLDRKALPNPNLSVRLLSESYVAPRTPIESDLAAIWSEVLGIPQIGIYDNFFKLGGNSILAIKLIVKINKFYQTYLKISDIFICQIIETLASKIVQNKGGYSPVIKLNKEYEKQNMFMVHPAGGGCETYVSLSNKLSSHFSCYGIDSYNLYHEFQMDNLHTLANYYLSHIDNIMTNTSQKTYHLLGWSLGGLISLEIASILEKRGCAKINVYLLDTIILDDDLIQLNNNYKKDMEKNIWKLKERMFSQGYDESYIKRRISLIDIEDKISQQNLSSTLKKTRIILFKAINIMPTPFIEMAHHIKSLPYNNVDKIIADKSKLELVPLNCHHENIFVQEEQSVYQVLTKSMLNKRVMI